VTHVVTVSNPGDRPVRAHLVSPREGADPLVADVAVPARTAVPVGADAFGGTQPGSISVSADGPVVASHRLTGEGVAEEAVCADRGGRTWYFPAADSFNGGTTAAGSALLWVYNPFPADASIDVTIVTEAGVRQPANLTGFVIGARSSRSIELADVAQRREQFAAVVETRAGRVVAELVQASDGTSSAPRGLRIQTGVSEPSMRWLFPDSEGVAGVEEQLVVQNPAAEPVTVQVAVQPDGADPAAYPEPFVLDVPARRYVVVELTKETRLPPAGARTITVETDARTGVVAERLVGVRSKGGWPLTSGTAGSTGARVESTRWTVPRLDRAEAGRSILRLVNTSPDSIALVDISAIAAGKAAAAPGGDRVEVPAGGALTVDVGAAAAPDVPTMLRLESSTPIVVERRAFASGNSDLWVVPAVADRERVQPVGALPSVVEPGG
jgi:hypothetical protein